MTLYDAVLNAPDHKTRKDALDRYRIELLKEGMERAAATVEHFSEHIRQATKDLGDVAETEK